MQNENLERVIEQEIGGIPMENFMADLLSKLEEAEVNIEVFNLKVRTLQQLNNRHKNIIDAQRVQLKEIEFGLKANSKII